ncbi:thiamine transporter 1 [Alosa sapidissima]|uniref:thiamine transporter 1 n=1 Tax=Alosa sapidissima TaxID=34773 RepID=UPI001C0815A9|nr:thiamine transporter 1 [Alosa sapidissima]XP_041920228.1 thiamine transporter 1 [Alosa sapidissima]
MECVKTWRTGWAYPTTLLCAYGFFTTVKPLEPFLTPYLTGPDKNLTIEQLTNQIYPVSTYSYLAVLVPVFLLTDWLRYKPVIVFHCSSLLVTTGMLLWLDSVPQMQATQFFYGVVMASEVAYYSYIYSVVDLRHYRKATSYCRATQLLGYTVGSVLGQLLVSFGLLSYHYILVFTLVLIALAWGVSWLLPMPQRSMFFHQRVKTQHRSGTEDEEDGNDQPVSDVPKTVEICLNHSASPDDTSHTAAPVDMATLQGAASRGRSLSSSSSTKSSVIGGAGIETCADPPPPAEPAGCVGVLVRLWRDFLQCYSTPGLLRWSLWWALATCGYNQILNYVQVLWEHIEPSSNFTVYNGGVEAASSLFGATTAYAIGFTQVDWHQWGELALGSFSGMGGGALYLMVFSGNIWACYCGYVLFKCLYMLLITIAMFQIAADLSMERYALIFGANNFGALVLQTVITAVVVDSGGLSLDIVTQFIIYGSYFCVIALVFFVWGVYNAVSHKRHRDSPKQTEVTQADLCSDVQHKF